MKRFQTCLVLALMVFGVIGAGAQTFNLQGYVDTYIATDNSRYDDPSYSAMRLYSPINEHKNQFGVNIAQLSGSVDADMYYGTLTLHYGTFPSTNWQGAYPMIQEAFAGVKLSDMISVDAGYFTTYIGNEAILPKDNWLSSHSLVTMMEPYYHAGIRGHFQLTDKFKATLLILNGLTIFEENNENKTIGLKLEYNEDKFGLSYAGAFGNEVPGSPNGSLLTMFHNVNANIDISEDFKAKFQFDYASTAAPEAPEGAPEQDPKSSIGFALQGMYKFVEKWSGALRIAYVLNDENHWVTAFPPVNGLGLTLGVQYAPTDNSYIRLEGRMISFDEGELINQNDPNSRKTGEVFHDGEEYTNSRMEVALNFGVTLDFLSTTP